MLPYEQILPDVPPAGGGSRRPSIDTMTSAKKEGLSGSEDPSCPEKLLTMKEDKRVLLSSSTEASPEELAASVSSGDREIHHPNGE